MRTRKVVMPSEEAAREGEAFARMAWGCACLEEGRRVMEWQA